MSVENQDESKISPEFEKADRDMIMVISIVLMILISLFFLYVMRLGLLDYNMDETDLNNYYARALDYRERRVALAMTYRTFLSCVGFVLGFSICTFGGIFVLRRSQAFFTASTGEQLAQTMSGQDVETSTQLFKEFPKAYLSTTSPGLVFMIGGVVVIVFSQWISKPIVISELFPPATIVACPTDGKGKSICEGKVQVIQIPNAQSNANKGDVADPVRELLCQGEGAAESCEE